MRFDRLATLRVRSTREAAYVTPPFTEAAQEGTRDPSPYVIRRCRVRKHAMAISREDAECTGTRILNSAVESESELRA